MAIVISTSSLSPGGGDQSFLQLAQAFCELYNLPVPAYLKGTSDAGVLQIRRLLNKVGLDIRQKSNWEVISKRVTWLSVADEDQGLVSDLLTENPEHIVPNTFWDNTARLRILGPISDARWQELKALPNTGPFYQFRVSEGAIRVLPTMLADHELSVIYKSKNWISVTGTSPAQYTDLIDEDDDVPLFRSELMLLGLEYFWRKTKQMTYSKEEAVYEQACLNAASVDNVKPTISMDGAGREGWSPYILVPAGSWPTS